MEQLPEFRKTKLLEFDREAVVGVSEAGNRNLFDCTCEGMSSQKAILHDTLSYLRHTPSPFGTAPSERGPISIARSCNHKKTAPSSGFLFQSFLNA